MHHLGSESSLSPPRPQELQNGPTPAPPDSCSQPPPYRKERWQHMRLQSPRSCRQLRSRGQRREGAGERASAGDLGTRGPESYTSAPRAKSLGLASLHRAGFFLAGAGVPEAPHAFPDRSPSPWLPAPPSRRGRRELKRAAGLCQPQSPSLPRGVGFLECRLHQALASSPRS